MNVTSSSGMPAKLAKHKLFRWLALAGLGGAGLVTLGIVAAVASVHWFGRRAAEVDPAALAEYRPTQVTRVLARDGRVIGELFTEERRTVVRYDQIPEHVIHAFLAAEDADFFAHAGLDWFGVARAMFVNARSGELRQGASTITQQVIKNTLLGQERTVERKSEEILLAQRLERVLGKEHILWIYLNEIYFGEGRYGVEEAARCYFGKSVGELDIGEAATLAALPRAPGKVTPFRDPERTKARQVYVLEQMRDKGFIDAVTADHFIALPIAVTKPEPVSPEIAPEFVDAAHRLLVDRFGTDALPKLGATVWTTVDIELQTAAREAVVRGLEELDERHRKAAAGEPAPEAALLLADVEDGAIMAMIGGRSAHRGQWNRALEAERQPGSTFKPWLFLAALRDGGTTAVSFVEGDDGRSITVREALAESDNTAAAAMFRLVGPEKIHKAARDVGITATLTPHPSLALGASEVTMHEQLTAYLTLAREGTGVVPRFVERIEIEEVTGPERSQSRRFEPSEVADFGIERAEASLLTSLLESVVDEGSGHRARALGRPVAGKTGTTDDNRDAWFAGYTRDHVAIAWVGFDRPQSLGKDETGGRAAVPIWVGAMKAASHGPAREFAVDESIVVRTVDPRLGGLACRPENTWFVPAECSGGWFFPVCEPARVVSHTPFLRCSDPSAWRRELFLPGTEPASALSHPAFGEQDGVAIASLGFFDGAVATEQDIAARRNAAKPVHRFADEVEGTFLAWASAEERTGTTVIELRLARDGTHSEPPRVVSSSGDSRFDSLATWSIERHALGPLDATLVDPVTSRAEVRLRFTRTRSAIAIALR